MDKEKETDIQKQKINLMFNTHQSAMQSIRRQETEKRQTDRKKQKRCEFANVFVKIFCSSWNRGQDGIDHSNVCQTGQVFNMTSFFKETSN